MKNKIVRIVALGLLICLCVGLLPACKENASKDNETPIELLSVIANKKSDYVIVHGAADELGKSIANDLCSILYKTYGVSLAIRSDSAEYEHEILVGNTNRNATAQAVQQLDGASDFFIGCVEDSVVLYADSVAAMKRMMITLRDRFIQEQPDSFGIPKTEAYLYSEHRGEGDSFGAVVDLFRGGGTNYSIIINEDDQDCDRIARYIQSEMQKLGVSIKIYEDFEEYSDNREYEFIIGYPDISRSEVQTVKSALGSNDFIVTCSGKKLFLLASDVDSLMKGAEYFVTYCLSRAKDGNLSIRECDEYRYALNGGNFVISDSKLSELYQSVLKRYPTLYEWYLRAGTVSDDGKRDQKLVEALVERMGTAAVFCVGSYYALYNGMSHPLNPNDYSQCATVADSKIYIPTAFANLYFGTNYETDGYKVVELNALVEKTGATLEYDENTGLVILTPANVASFSEDGVVSGGYNNATYRQRMLQFFQEPEFPMPNNNTEQSRVVIDAPQDYFPENSYDYSQMVYTVCYSPSILTVKETDGSNVFYASYELSTIRNGDELSTVTVIRVSRDDGATWQEIAKIHSLRWAELFGVGDAVYVVGSNLQQNYLQLNRLESDGTVTSKMIYERHSGIMQTLIADGILYVPTDFGMLSISTDADLMEPSNWTVTNDPNELVSREWFIDLTGKNLGNAAIGEGNCDLMEPNAVKGQDGEIYVMYRIECQPNANYAVLFKLSDDRSTLELLADGQSLIDFPTTISRFTIKYDAETKLYVCVSNLYTVVGCERARNVVGLSVSSDLRNWKTVDTLLIEREMMNAEASCWAHAYQYPDFDFDGDDLVLVIREATGYTNNFHDGKYCTFYRVSDFREMISD